MRFKKFLIALIIIMSLTLTSCTFFEDLMSDLYIPSTTTEGNTPTTTDPVTTDPTSTDVITDITTITTNIDFNTETNLNYGYLDLERYSKKDKYQGFYNEIYETLVAFDSSTRNVDSVIISGETYYQIASIKFQQEETNNLTHVTTESSYGLTFEEASAILKLVELDHPEFYYMSNRVRASGTSGNNLTVSYVNYNLLVFISADYKDYSTRQAHKEALATFDSAIDTLVSEYIGNEKMMVKTIHDYIINHATYAYKADGVTPDDSSLSHNMMGIVYAGKGVCESYAELFTYELKRFNIYGISADGIGYTSTGSGGHAWNIVRIDGIFYGFDATWNDGTHSNKYYGISGTKLAVDHEVTESNMDDGINYLYKMPVISSVDLA